MYGGELTRENGELLDVIAKLLTCVPTDVVDYLVKHCVVISSWQSYYGQYLPGELIRDKDVILLSEYLLDGEENQRDKTMLHEFAHCWLKHKSPALEESMTGEDIWNQEEEADKLVYEWSRKKKLEQDKMHL